MTLPSILFTDSVIGRRLGRNQSVQCGLRFPLLSSIKRSVERREARAPQSATRQKITIAQKISIGETLRMSGPIDQPQGAFPRTRRSKARRSDRGAKADAGRVPAPQAMPAPHWLGAIPLFTPEAIQVARARGAGTYTFTDREMEVVLDYAEAQGGVTLIEALTDCVRLVRDQSLEAALAAARRRAH